MVAAAHSGTIKFLCSYNGIIAPRPADGLLRYYGGLTRLLAVHPHISYAELMVKLVEFCGFSVDLKCALPHGDLETLVTIKSEEELANLMEEYDRASPSKIRAVLTPPKSLKRTTSPTPISNCSDDVGSSYNYRIGSRSRVVACQRNDDDDDDDQYYSPPPPPPCSVDDDDFCWPKSCRKYYSSSTTTRSSSFLGQQYYSPDLTWIISSSTGTGNYYYNPKAVDRFSCRRILMRRRSYCDVIGSAAPRVSSCINNNNSNYYYYCCPN